VLAGRGAGGSMDATGADDEQRIAELLAAVQASSDAIYVVDADGMITSWNRSAERILGYAASDAIGRPVSILVPAHRVDDPAVFARVMHGERIERHETEQCRRDGSLVPVWLTVLPVRDQSGRVVGASFAARDVAELDMAQATLAMPRAGCARARRWPTSGAGPGTSTPTRCNGPTSCSASTASTRWSSRACSRTISPLWPRTSARPCGSPCGGRGAR